MALDHAVTDALLGVPLFADVDREMLPLIVDAAKIVRVGAGDVLFHEGDEGDALYVVVSGRLEVTRGDVFVAALGRGAMVGETALLTEGPRTATVRAVRDAELLCISRDGFAQLLADPQFARELTRALAQRLSEATVAAPSQGRTVSIVTVAAAADGLSTRAAADAVRAAWPRPHRVTVLDPGIGAGIGAAPWADRIEQAERASELVVLVADMPIAGSADDTWTRFALRQADRALVLTRAGLAPPPGWRAEWDVLIASPAPAASALTPWLGRVRGHHWLRSGPAADADLARAARRVVGTSLGLVLSGGGARGLAHLGVLAALTSAGIAVDRLGGTSMGALVSALAATGAGPAEMVAVMRSQVVDRRPFADYTVPRYALVRGRRGERMLRSLFGSTGIEELPTGWFGISCDLGAGETVVHRDGPVWEAVAASISLPGIAPPRRFRGRLVVDGGVINNLPVDVMLDDGEGPVLAVDVGRRLAAPAPGSGSLPTVVETLAAAAGLAAFNGASVARRLARVLITPELDDIGLLDWHRLDAAVAAGRRSGEAALDAIAAMHAPVPPTLIASRRPS